MTHLILGEIEARVTFDKQDAFAPDVLHPLNHATLLIIDVVQLAWFIKDLSAQI